MVSSNSSSYIDGMAIMTNPRTAPNSPKTVFLDAHFFLKYVAEKDDVSGEEHQVPQGIVACLRFFNDRNIQFQDPHYSRGLFFVRAMVVQMDSAFELGAGALDAAEYAFVGDIEECIPLHELIPPLSTVNNSGNEGDDAAGAPTMRVPDIDYNHRPRLTICGLPSNASRAKATFDVDVEQYTQFGKTVRPFPVSCTIIDSARWSRNENKPTPYAGKYIQASGWLTGLEDFPDTASKHKERFTMDVSQVVFLGSVAAPKYGGPSTPSQSTGKSSFSATPSPLPFHNLKRRRVDSEARPSSSPSA